MPSRAAGAAGSNARGAAFMVAAMACLVLNDAVMKTLLAEMTWHQTLVVRGPFTIALALALAFALDGRRAVAGLARFARNGPTALRVAAELGATSFFLMALHSLKLANVTAITQTLPLLLVVGGALFLGERVGPHRWWATAAGFAGVLLIVQPGTDAFDWAAIYALASAAFMAMRDLATRTVPADVPSTAVTVLTNVAVFLFAGLFTLLAAGEAPPLPPLDAWTVLRLAMSATFITVGFLLLVLGTRAGEASFVAPFRYSIILWALIAGYALFGEVPSALELFGAGVVAAAGLYAFFREARAA